MKEKFKKRKRKWPPKQRKAHEPKKADSRVLKLWQYLSMMIDPIINKNIYIVH